MKKTFDTVIRIITMGLLACVAVDMVAWAFSGKYANTGAGFVNRLVDKLTDLPIKILYAVFNVVVGLIESVLKVIFGVLGLSSIVEKLSLPKLETA